MRQTQLERHSTKGLIILPKAVKVMKNKEAEKLSQSRGDQGDMRTQFNRVPALGPGTKRTLVEKLVTSTLNLELN